MEHFSGIDYIRLDIASQYGLDKESWAVRFAWVHEHEDELEAMEDTADDFFRYAAAVRAYRQVQGGKPTGHLVGFDACSSGAQILSTLTGCEQGCMNTGVIGQKRMDVYTVITEVMNKILRACTVYDRKIVKNAFMTYLYNSKAEPIKAFGKDSPELDAFYDACFKVCPGAAGLMPIMAALWDDEALYYKWVMPDTFTVKCLVKATVDDKIEVDTLPGHPVFEYRHKINTEIESGEEGSLFIPANITHSIDGFVVRELTARCDYSPGQLRTVELLLVHRLQKDIDIESPIIVIEQLWKRHKMLSIEGIEYVNDWSVNQMSKEYCWALLNLIRRTMKNKPFKIICIHDEFKCHPNYMNTIRQTYIDIFAEMADSTMLDVIFSDITGEPIEVEKLNNNLSDLIRESEYMLS